MEDELYGLVSGSVSGLSGRIYPMVLPENATLPAATFQRISTNPIHTRDGLSSLEMNRVQFVVYGKTYGNVRTNADAIKSLFNVTGTSTSSVLGAWTENQFDDVETETRYMKSIIEVMYFGNS